MLTPKYLETLPDSVVDLYTQVEMDILSDMARRLSTYDYWIPAADWQARKLQESGVVYNEIVEAMVSATERSKAEVEALMREAGKKTLATDAGIYSANGFNTVGILESAALKKILSAGYSATNQTMKNLTGTTASTASKQFEDVLDRAWLQVHSGAFSTDTAIRTAIKDLSRQGVGAITYPKGRVDQLEVAVRRAVVTGVNQTSGRLQLALADELGSDLVETTAHAGARPQHASWQGQIFSLSGKSRKYPNFRQSTGYGTGAGLCGWNCRHGFNPFFEGMPRAYSDEMLKAYENKDYSYNGVKMTEYEASQQQRYIERNIRRWKRENVAMRAAGLDVSESAGKIRQWQDAQQEFMKQTGLKKQSGREITPKNIDSAMKRDIIKLGKVNEDNIAKMNFSEMSDLQGKLSNRAVRKWYIYHDEQIPKQIDMTQSLEMRARQACNLRNEYRTQARDLMREQITRTELDITDPNKTFEILLAEKMDKKSLTREQACEYLLDSAKRTRKSVNKTFGLE